MKWWRAARFGMFIHWGVYSVPAGVWNGTNVTASGAEWIMNRGRIPLADYQKFATQFNPVKFNAKEWVKLAKNAGMKYIVITSKHHDGFAMFHSKADPFNIYDATPFERDPLAELAAACKKQGIKLGFYYSQAQDWNHPGGAAAGSRTGQPVVDKQNHWDAAQQGSMDDYIITNNYALLAPTVKPLALANQSGVVDLTVKVTDPGGLSASDTFTLTAGSHAPGIFVWNGPGAGANNWSASGNWIPAGPPESLDDVKFFDLGASGVAVSNVNNFVDANAGGTIASLQYANTNDNHTTRFSSGKILNITGSGGLVVGTETDNGSAQTVFTTVTGPGGTLVINNSSADLIVRQGSANNSSQRATLEMSGLGNFIANVRVSFGTGLPIGIKPAVVGVAAGKNLFRT